MQEHHHPITVCVSNRGLYEKCELVWGFEVFAKLVVLQLGLEG
jgi:hypothetical protein